MKSTTPRPSSLRRNTSMTTSTSLQHALSRSHGHASSSSMRSSSSTPNMSDLMSQSAPGRKYSKKGTFTPSLLAQPTATNKLETLLPPPTTESLALVLKPSVLAVDNRPRCAVCNAALIVEPVGDILDGEDSLAALLHLQTVPNPIEENEPEDFAYVYVREQVWENQCLYEGNWGREKLSEVNLSPFVALDSRLQLNSLPEKISGTSTWLDEWQTDLEIPDCDDEGWIYGDVEYDEDNLLGVRRRRLTRHRKIRHTEEGWWNELMDRSLNFSSLKTPMCHACANKLQSTLQTEYQQLLNDDDAYTSYLEQFEQDDYGQLQHPARPKSTKRHYYKQSSKPSHMSWQDDEDNGDIDLESLSMEELESKSAALSEILRLINEESQVILRNRELIWSCATELASLQHQTFDEGAIVQLASTFTKEERTSVGTFAVHASDMLRCLQRYNVMNDTFHIWHEGSFGTINGLRLGRLPSKPVEWTEINAALGQATLLLATVASRANLQFARHTPVARGSYSKMLTSHGKERRREYPLYSDGSFFQRQKFNQALVFFLECVDEAGQRAMREEPTLRFPYKIFKGKIGELAISVGGNDEQWTRALKYLLTHLKWLLAWVAKRYP
ncbi:beclin-1 [Thraustotheca clavata]|uniref:Beclin-1 n=1 Tax=Thraustotheca clavata TaxID=74557 RepID=A0A1V9ZC45_9STRA|nr:beclin-1 [Thraustotheca clavata]